MEKHVRLCGIPKNLNPLKPSGYYREVLAFVDRFTALRFTTTGAPPAARREGTQSLGDLFHGNVR
jgi:hypothetical protein